MYSEKWKKDANLDEFWAMIDLARKDYPAFITTLKSMNRRGLIRFSWLFEDLASALGAEPYLQYANPEFSEDALDDLWNEVVCRGRAFYENVINHPDQMPADADNSDPSHKMRYAANRIFRDRYGKELPPYSYDY